MNKPRIFLGSSGKQASLLQAITRGLGDVAYVFAQAWSGNILPAESVSTGCRVDGSYATDRASGSGSPSNARRALTAAFQDVPGA